MSENEKRQMHHYRDETSKPQRKEGHFAGILTKGLCGQSEHNKGPKSYKRYILLSQDACVYLFFISSC